MLTETLAFCSNSPKGKIRLVSCVKYNKYIKINSNPYSLPVFYGVKEHTVEEVSSKTAVMTKNSPEDAVFLDVHFNCHALFNILDSFC